MIPESLLRPEMEVVYLDPGQLHYTCKHLIMGPGLNMGKRRKEASSSEERAKKALVINRFKVKNLPECISLSILVSKF